MMSKKMLVLGLLALAGAAMIPGALAQDGGPAMQAGQIVKKLSKDIVLARPGGAPVAAPSVDLQVQFAFNSSQLLPEGKRQLDELGRALNDKALASWGFELAGHTDQVGGAEYNMALSLERANTVRQYLIVTHGLVPQRLIPLGLGYSRLADRSNPGAAVNRRVEVRRVALNANSTVSPAAPASGGRLVPLQ